MVDAGGSIARTVRFSPGTAVAFVGVHVAGLVADDPRSDLVKQIWAAANDGARLDDLVDLLAAVGVRSLPSIGLVEVDGSEVRVLVRGEIAALFEPMHTGRLVPVVGDRVHSWVEHSESEVGGVHLHVADDLSELGAFETTGGLFPASRLAIVFDAPDVFGRETEPPLVPTVAPLAPPRTPPPYLSPPALPGPPSPTPAPPVPAAAQPSEVGPDAAGELSAAASDDVEPASDALPTVVHDGSDSAAPELEASDPGRADTGEAASEDDAVREFADDGPADSGDAPSPGPDDSSLDRHTLVGPLDDLIVDVGRTVGVLDMPDDDPDDGADAPDRAVRHDAPQDHGADDYDALFGATQFRTVEDAAVRVDGVIDEEPGGIPAPQPLIERAPGADGRGDGLDGDHDGMTITLAELMAMQKSQTSDSQNAGASGSARSAQPQVHAVSCPSGHLNPPHASVCRVCRLEVADQAQVTVPRPVLGILRFTDGRTVDVSRPLILGRSPKLDAAISGELPELVVLSSPMKEVSGTHLEIRLDDWKVLVVDRQSTNGTTIRLPGRDPQRLHPGEPFPITIGTSVNLADEVEFVLEAGP